MGARLGAEHRDPGAAAAGQIYGDGDGGAVAPVLVGDCEGGAGPALEEVRRDEDFDTVFFGVFAVLGVGAGNEYSGAAYVSIFSLKSNE